MPALRILLVDDHVTVRQGLKLVIDGEPDMTVIAECGDGRQAIQQALALHPDVVVMDVSMPGMNGLLATRTLHELRPRIAIVALTRFNDDAHVQELLGAGATGYILKQSLSSELLRGIRTTAKGGLYLDSTIAETLTARLTKAKTRASGPTTSSITGREAEVLRKIAWGQSHKEIAAELNLSVKTIEVHKANAMRKLDLHGRIDVVKYALLQDWLKDE